MYWRDTSQGKDRNEKSSVVSSVKGSIAYLCTDAGNVNNWLINAAPSLFPHPFSRSLSTLPMIVPSSCFLQVVLLYRV
jgi:hypothetical protein